MQVIFKPKVGNKEHWEIFLEGEKQKEVHRVIFGRNPVFPPLSSEKDFQIIFDDFEYRRVKGYIIWRLSTQPYHSEQLAKLLRERLVQSKTIKRVIQEYQKMGFLDDESWLKNFMQQQQKRYGLSFILAKLRAKGLSSETLHHLAKEWKNPEEELQTIQHIIESRYRSKDLSQYKNRQKVFAALIRKGYSFEQIQIAFRQLSSND